MCHNQFPKPGNVEGQGLSLCAISREVGTEWDGLAWIRIHHFVCTPEPAKMLGAVPRVKYRPLPAAASATGRHDGARWHHKKIWYVYPVRQHATRFGKYINEDQPGTGESSMIRTRWNG